MLLEMVWDMLEYGIFNLYGFLLLCYWGVVFINWAVINGDIEMGVIIFFIWYEIDIGDVFLQEKMFIGLNEIVGEVYDWMMMFGVEIVLKIV